MALTAAALAAAALILSACTSTPAPPPDVAEGASDRPSAGITLDAPRPTFHGRRRVGLVPALLVYDSEDCQPSLQVACGPDNTPYRRMEPARRTTLTSAVMQPARNQASWSVTVEFRPRGPLVRVARRAREMGGYVVVLDGPVVLAVAGGLDERRGTLVVPSLDKGQAWTIVASIGSGS